MSIHIIPTIYEPTGELATDADGLEYPVMQAIQGYHVNTIEETIEGAEDYLLSEENVKKRKAQGDPNADRWNPPSTPYNLYAGRDASEHNFYCFPDEATFRQFVPEPQELAP